MAGTPEPAAAISLYDWDLATAALAASHAVQRQLDASLAQSRLSQQPSPLPKGALVSDVSISILTQRCTLCALPMFPEVMGACFAEPQAASGITAAPAQGRRGFGSFLSHVKDAASRVVDDTSKNLTQAGPKLWSIHPHFVDLLYQPVRGLEVLPERDPTPL